MSSSDRADSLEAGYTRSHRAYEWAGLAFAGWCLGVAGANALALDSHAGHWLGAIVLGLAFADLVSGIVHWAFDTWGSVDTPVLGALAIRTFRHHHLDPKAITRHDVVETNGHNAMLSVTLSAPAALWGEELSPLLTLFLFWAAVFVACTSQLHKWAHVEQAPRPIRALQSAGLLLSREAHEAHHTAPYAAAYCVATGWMNAVLDRAGAFRAFERAITRATGARPRAEE